MENKYYFYNGFRPPEVVRVEDLEIEGNYKGDVTEEVMEIHEEFKDDQDIDYNIHMGEYGIIRNPSLEDFRELNRSFGLREDEFLGEFL